MKKLILCLSLCYLAIGTYAQMPMPVNGFIEDVGGIAGKRSYSGDGGDALRAHFASPLGITMDRWHNIYIADTLNHRIRRIDARTGYVDTVAGTGKGEFSNDGGHADMAGLKGPTAIKMDSYGNLFVADTGNNRIRMITPKGYMYTVAGNGRKGYEGEGTKARNTTLNRPTGLAIGPKDELYFADSGNNRIRKIDRTTGLITTVAGLGEAGDSGDGGLAINARLNRPSAILFDKHYNMYIADTKNHKVRFIEHKSQRIFTLAGTGKPGYGGDNSNSSDNCLFKNPTGLALDKLGQLYVSDTDNQRIRRISIDLSTRHTRVETVVGNGQRGYNGDDMNAWDVKLAYPGPMLISPHDRLYFVDTGNNVIRVVAGISTVNPPTSYNVYGKPEAEEDTRNFYEVLFAPQIEAARKAQ